MDSVPCYTKYFFVVILLYGFTKQVYGDGEYCDYTVLVSKQSEIRKVYCEYGCCGTTAAQKCCDYSLSDTVIIVACVVGSLVVVAVAIGLIFCIKNKNKDRVTRIRQRTRQRGVDIIRPAAQVPKPPPYIARPPDYDANGEGSRRFAGFSLQPPGPSNVSSLRRTHSQRTATRATPVSSRRIQVEDIEDVDYSRVDEVMNSRFQRNNIGERATVPRRNRGPNMEIFTTQRTRVSGQHNVIDVESEDDVNSVSVPAPITFVRDDRRQEHSGDEVYARNSSPGNGSATGGVFIPETGDTLRTSRAHFQRLPVRENQETISDESRDSDVQNPSHGQFIDIFPNPGIPETNSTSGNENSGTSQVSQQRDRQRNAISGGRNNVRVTSQLPSSPPPEYTDFVVSL